MITPRITNPYEPGLPALGDDLENYLVTGGGSITLKSVSYTHLTLPTNREV